MSSNKANLYAIGTKVMLQMQNALDGDDRQGFLKVMTEGNPINNICVMTGDPAVSQGFIRLMQDAIRKWILT